MGGPPGQLMSSQQPGPDPILSTTREECTWLIQSERRKPSVALATDAQVCVGALWRFGSGAGNHVATEGRSANLSSCFHLPERGREAAEGFGP